MNIKLLFTLICLYGCAMQASEAKSEVELYVQGVKSERANIKKQAEAKIVATKVTSKMRAEERANKLPEAKSKLSSSMLALVQKLQEKIKNDKPRISTYNNLSMEAAAAMKSSNFVTLLPQDSDVRIEFFERHECLLNNADIPLEIRYFWPQEKKLQKMNELKNQLDDILILLTTDTPEKSEKQSS